MERTTLDQVMSRYESSLLAAASQASKRWGVALPESPNSVKAACLTALKRSISVACSQGFEPTYPDDHSWSSIGLRGLTVARLKKDEEPTGLDKAGEDWGVFAIAKGMGMQILVPIAADLSEDAARYVRGIVDGNKERFLDLEDLPSVFLAADPSVGDGQQEIEVSIGCALWDDVRDLSQMSDLPLSKAVFFRRPVSWDILRARMSGAACPPLPRFVEEEFVSRRDRSMRFDAASAEATRSLLSSAAKRTVDLDTPSGRNWVALVVDGLGSLGLGKPLEGLSVLIRLRALSREHGPAGLRTVCVAYGLDPVQASYLGEIVAENPDAFHMLGLEADRAFTAVSVMVVPDMSLGGLSATSDGRAGAAYDRLVGGTVPLGDFLNA